MKKLFLITPYSSDPDFEQKKEIVARLAAEHNLVLLMPGTEELGTQKGIEQTLKMMQEADFAIADLSYERPSCYYEVGYLQGLGKPVYIIAKSSTLIHLINGKLHGYNNIIDYKCIISEILNAFKSTNSK